MTLVRTESVPFLPPAMDTLPAKGLALRLRRVFNVLARPAGEAAPVRPASPSVDTRSVAGTVSLPESSVASTGSADSAESAHSFSSLALALRQASAETPLLPGEIDAIVRKHTRGSLTQTERKQSRHALNYAVAVFRFEADPAPVASQVNTHVAGLLDLATRQQNADRDQVGLERKLWPVPLQLGTMDALTQRLKDRSRGELSDYVDKSMQLAALAGRTVLCALPDKADMARFERKCAQDAEGMAGVWRQVGGPAFPFPERRLALMLRQSGIAQTEAFRDRVLAQRTEWLSRSISGALGQMNLAPYLDKAGDMHDLGLRVQRLMDGVCETHRKSVNHFMVTAGVTQDHPACARLAEAVSRAEVLAYQNALGAVTMRMQGLYEKDIGLLEKNSTAQQAAAIAGTSRQCAEIMPRLAETMLARMPEEADAIRNITRQALREQEAWLGKRFDIKTLHWYSPFVRALGDQGGGVWGRLRNKLALGAIPTGVVVGGACLALLGLGGILMSPMAPVILGLGALAGLAIGLYGGVKVVAAYLEQRGKVHEIRRQQDAMHAAFADAHARLGEG